ncbi:ATP-binding protein [Deinococcus pimensis]|uniref:ATP-binding protein n=1 Tax=Deinococcus pimensis TaxID=309888 RepID=UPI0004BAA5D1|nr:AAA family ATPase [Deinococcus pimensis]
MKPSEVRRFLERVVEERIYRTIMLWGKPGIGKSALVAEVAHARHLALVDLRLSQLAPTDVRGLPVPDLEENVARWLAPSFLPRQGRTVLFLDEFNLAPPVMQGIAQQLILDRRVGDYVVPDDMFVWAAGNRKEDRASVFDLPRPVANRMLHLTVEEDLDDFRAHAARAGVHEKIVAFLGYRPAVLHDMSGPDVAFPTPRTWAMASELHTHGIDVGPAVGDAAAGEFYSFLRVYDRIPDAAEILRLGERSPQAFPGASDERWAITTALALRAGTPEEAGNALKWIGADHLEWMQMTASLLVPRLRERGVFRDFALLLTTDERLGRLMDAYTDLLD